MTSCKFFIASEMTIEDASTSLWTLVKLVQKVQVAVFAGAIPLHMLSQWEFGESQIGKSFDVETVLRHVSGYEKVSQKRSAKISHKVQHIRMIGLNVPEKAGVYALTVRIRIDGGKWIESPQWSLEFEQGSFSAQGSAQKDKKTSASTKKISGKKSVAVKKAVQKKALVSKKRA